MIFVFLVLILLMLFPKPCLATVEFGAQNLPNIPFVMSDCRKEGSEAGMNSNDWFLLHPEWGPVGGWHDWGQGGCNSPGNYILKAQQMTVTLDNGQKMPKPVGIGLTAPLPDDSAKSQVQNLAAAYNDNPAYPNLAALIIGCRAQIYGECSSGDEGIIQEVLPLYRKYFTKLPTFVQCTQHNCGSIAQMYAYDSYAYKNAGVKCNGWFMDEDNAVTWVDNQMEGGCMGFAELYHEKIPVGFEPKAGCTTCESYSFLMEGLSHHPDFLDIQKETLSRMAEFVQLYHFPLLKFTRDHLQKTVKNTPDVWTVLRSSQISSICESGNCQYARCVPCSYGEAPDSSCNEVGKRCKAVRYCWNSGGKEFCSGPWKGNFNYWLYPREDAPQSRSVVIRSIHSPTNPCSWKMAELPLPAAIHPYARYSVKRTDQASNNPYLSFDIDDRYQGNTWAVTVTFVNQGSDYLALEYKDINGNLVKKRIQKGAGLGEVNQWIDYKFVLNDADFHNKLGDKIDFRLSSENDGDEIVHRVLVKASSFCSGGGPGDLNCDGKVNNDDLDILLSNWGVFDETDLTILLQHWSVITP